MSNSPTDIEIFRTGRIYELDMVTQAFDDLKIPYFRREETVSGVQFAMPAMPAPAPGVWYAVRVPEIAAEDARAVLAELPLGDPEETPGVWHFNSNPRTKRVFWFYAAAMLSLMALSVLISVKDTIRGFFQ